MDNVGEQVHSIEQLLTDIQFLWENPTNICLPPHAKQVQSPLANSHFSPLPSPATPELFALSTGHLPYGSLPTRSTTGTVDFSMASNPGSYESECNAMSFNLAHEAHAPVPPLPNQHQTPYESLCGLSRDFGSHPALPVPSTILSVPQSPPPTFPHSYPNVGQYDAWMRHVLDGSMVTCASPPSASGFPGGYADHGCLPDARADPQPSIAQTHDAMSSTQPPTFPYNKPTHETYFQVRFFGCHWLTPNGALCEAPVNADRRSVVAHLQDVHGIKPGEEKARETCLWEQCGTILNKESLARHILTVHLKEKVRCVECGLLFAREDSLKRHLVKRGQHKGSRDKGAARQPSRNHVGFR